MAPSEGSSEGHLMRRNPYLGTSVGGSGVGVCVLLHLEAAVQVSVLSVQRSTGVPTGRQEPEGVAMVVEGQGLT